MYREDGKSIDNIYENYDVTRGEFGKDIADHNAMRIQSSELTESVCVKIRSSRAAPVCLVLLCVLLLTAVIVLGVMFSQERQQFTFKNENLTNERDQLIFKNKNLTNKRDQLRNELQIYAGWTFYQTSFYYMPNETKNWIESRRYCTERGADLIIINNREEQDFVKNMSGAALVWIGLTDSDVEGRWKWADGTNMTSGFWASREPNGGREENCVVTVSKLQNSPVIVRWFDYACNLPFQWICEKNISQLIMP